MSTNFKGKRKVYFRIKDENFGIQSSFCSSNDRNKDDCNNPEINNSLVSINFDGREDNGLFYRHMC